MSNKLPPLEEIEIDSAEYKKSNRRSFVKAGFFGLMGVLGVGWIFKMENQRELPWLLRQVNNMSDSFWKANFSKDARVAEATPDGKPFRVNGDAGLEETVDEKKWRLKVEDPELPEALLLTIEQIRALPSTEMKFEFKCIEGWSQNVQCRGVQVSEFMKAFDVGQRSQTSLSGVVKTPYEYAALESINGGYYVSMDAKSLLHSQTLLCYEINGQPLTVENGAPLRLMTAVKYGVKNIKQLAHIKFSDSPPADYWAERGYQDELMF